MNVTINGLIIAHIDFIHTTVTRILGIFNFNCSLHTNINFIYLYKFL